MTTPLSVADAQRFISKRYAGRATELTELGAGAWSQAYAFSLDGLDAVVRFGRRLEDFRKDQLMATHAHARLPIPTVVELGEAPGGYFAISERARGRLLDDLDGVAMRAALPAVMAALDAMREIDVEVRDGYGIWTPDGSAPFANWPQALLAIDQPNPRIPGWRAALEGSPTGAGRFDTAYSVLGDLVVGLPEERHLVHGDLLSSNVLVDGNDIVAVIDWGNAQYGDFLYDAAWLIYWWPWFPQWAAIDIRAELQRHWETHGGVPSDLDHRLRVCLIYIGLDAMAYNAFTRRWDDLARNAQQVAAMTDG
jgi:hygromycin-B 4-O-kinase